MPHTSAMAVLIPGRHNHLYGRLQPWLGLPFGIFRVQREEATMNKAYLISAGQL